MYLIPFIVIAAALGILSQDCITNLFDAPMVDKILFKASLASVSEEKDTLEEVYEPFLIMEGYLQRTPQGRTATEMGYQRLGLKRDSGHQQSLL